VKRASAPQRTHGSQLVELPAGEAAAVVVVADTHSQPHPNARAIIRKLAPRAILHAGDIGNLSVLDGLRELAPLLAIRGNIDEHAPGLCDSLDIEFKVGERRVLKVFLTHIAVYGPKLHGEVARSAATHGAGVVICGHSHVPFLGRDKGLVVFNPGSIGPRRFTLPITLGVLSFAPSGISFRHVSCETGETWLP
jgi:uncharacterized protein